MSPRSSRRSATLAWPLALFLLAALTFTTKATAQPRLRKIDVFQRIDEAFQRGELSRDQRIFYRVAALRAPQRLPERWRAIVRDGSPSHGSFTLVLVEAAQQLPHMAEPERSETKGLLWPDDLTYTIDVETPYPIRVTYDDPSLASAAQTTLDAAVTSYETEVTDWGFWEPAIEPGAEYYRYFLDSTGMGGGAYTAPYDEDPATPRYDLYSYIVVDPLNPESTIPTIVAHEFGHACQAAMDGAEALPFWENTATYLMSEVFPDGIWYASAFFPAFQSQPHKALDYMDYWQSDGYEYGGAVWIHFLEHYYAGGDPRWIRQVWEGTVQDSYVNEPDYFDVLGDMLSSEGGFDEMIRTFAQYRFFAGRDDDGQHIPGASTWPGSEVARIGTWRTNDIPVLDKEPPSSVQPEPNGCNYVVVELNQAPTGDLIFKFAGQSSARWNVDVLRVKAGTDTSYERMELDAQANGSLQLAAAQGERLVMVVCQLAPPGYDPDHQNWIPASYVYSIDTPVVAPTVTGVQPDEIARGVQGRAVQILGTAFIDGCTVDISGDGLTVGTPVVVSSEMLQVLVSVSPTATLGPRDVTVTNPGDLSGVGPGLLTIVDQSGPPDAGGGDGGDPAAEGPIVVSDCGCRSVGSSRLGWLPVALGLAAVCWLRARRRRRPAAAPERRR